MEQVLTPPAHCEPLEKVTLSSTEPEPASERRDLESPVTQQPGPQAPGAPAPATDQVKLSTTHLHRKPDTGVQRLSSVDEDFVVCLYFVTVLCGLYHQYFKQY